MKKLCILSVIVFSSHIFSQWTQTLNGVSIWSLAKDLNGNIYAGSLGSSSAIYKTTNLGMNWNPLTAANGQTVFSIAVDTAGNIFGANFSAGLLKSTNAGVNWTTVPVASFGGSSLNTVACGRNSHVYVGTNGAGFFRSTDNGNSFTQGGLTAVQVITISVDKYNSSIIYAGVTSTTAGPNGFYRSTDYGATFSANLNPNKNIYGIIQKTPTDLYSVSTTTGGPFDKSTDGGLNWVTINTGYIARGIADAGLDYIYIAGNGGVFLSTNNGVNFTNTSLTISATPVIKSDFRTYAGTSGTSNGGVWIKSDPLGITQTGITASDFSLSQNYPNPFNPSTAIEFSVKETAAVSIAVYDVLGREIERIVNENLSPGKYKIQWDASAYPSGIYYYMLKTNVFSETKKMILLK